MAVRFQPFFILTILFVGGKGSLLLVKPNPDVIDDRTTKLEVKCSIHSYMSPKDEVIAMQIMQGNARDPIVTAHNVNGLNTGDNAPFNMKAEGQVDTDYKNSYIKLTFDNPKRENTGVYKCVMYYMDEKLQMKTETESVTVGMNGCPDGWKLFPDDNTCLKGFLFKKEKTWDQARSSCQNEGGDLAIVKSKHKNNFILHRIIGQYGQRNWIGAYNAAKSGYDFKYVDGSAVGSGLFHPDEPNSNGRDKCVALNASPNPFYEDGLWTDEPCSDRRGYICQRGL